MKPEEIETLSFNIIDNEAGDHGFTHEKWSIVRRMIHTSADFDYIKSVCFSDDAVKKGVTALRQGKNIMTDTEMARSGIRKKSVEKFGGQVSCLINDATVAKTAKQQGTTRAKMAVDLSADQLEGGIYAVGNAPTALLRLIQLVSEGRIKPALVLGFPVGFVNAVESKALLLKTTVPFITNSGRKGGSNIAASVVNALIILAEENR